MTALDLMHDYIGAARRGDWETSAGYFDIRRCNVSRWRDGEITEILIFEAHQYAVDALLGD